MRRTPTPSIPPSPDFPVTSTFTKPLSRRSRWQSRSKAEGSMAFNAANSWSRQSVTSSVVVPSSDNA